MLAQCQSRETLFRTSAQVRKHLGSCVTQVFLPPKNDYLGFSAEFVLQKDVWRNLSMRLRANREMYNPHHLCLAKPLDLFLTKRLQSVA